MTGPKPKRPPGQDENWLGAEGVESVAGRLISQCRPGIRGHCGMPDCPRCAGEPPQRVPADHELVHPGRQVIVAIRRGRPVAGTVVAWPGAGIPPNQAGDLQLLINIPRDVIDYVEILDLD